MANFSEEMIERIWEKAQIVPGYDPRIWRKDFAGAWIRKDLYGVIHNYGWEIDHRRPKVMGGTDSYDNLFPVHVKNNRAKGDDYPHFKTIITSDGNKNIEKEQSWVVK